MTRKLILAGIAMMLMAISSCDEDTTTMGNSLTISADKFIIAADTFRVDNMYSIRIDSVLSRSSYCYLGRIKDPETGAYISCDFSTQFALIESDASSMFPTADHILNRDADGNAIADSCFLNVVVNSYTGDSLAAMKLVVSELGKPVEENRQYYTNFDLEKNGYVRTDGIRANKLYSISDLTLSDSIRNIRRSSSYYETIRIPLNAPYTDTQGNTYNNYGTYILRQYYNHPEYFKNSLAFTQKVCPGFHFKVADGLGMVAEVTKTQLSIHFRHQQDTLTLNSMKSIDATEEVMQTNHFTNDDASIARLLEDNTCTYMKSPAGIYTVVELPVDQIKAGHENDTIASAKIVFRRMNDSSELSDKLLNIPQTLLMVELDSLYSFFENRDLPDNMTTYLASYSSTSNSYTFSNISGLINHMYANGRKTANWNKVVLVPVQVTTTATSSNSSGSTTVASINNELRITSSRLVGGTGNPHEPVTMSIIYNESR